MNPSVENYVPIGTFYEGKREIAGEAFRDRFAVLEFGRELRVIAARGEALSVGTVLSVDPANAVFLNRALSEQRRVLMTCGFGMVMLFGDMMASGLIPAWFPEGDADALADAAKLLGRNDLTLLPSLRETDGREGNRSRSVSEVCRYLSEELAKYDSVFSKRKSDDFRLYCAEVAALAGCRVDVRDLPVGEFPLCESDRERWTLFLLCLFLSLRGANAEGPVFSMWEIGRHTVTTGMAYRSTDDSRKLDGDRFAFLEHPAFREMALERTEEGYCITATLGRYDPSGVLRAISVSERFVFLLRSA